MSLGIINQNENETTGMVSILTELKKYALNKEGEEYNVVLFGDGLTAHRVDAAKKLRAAAKVEQEKLPEFIPAPGFWHKRVNLTTIDMSKLIMAAEASSSPGTLPYTSNRYGHKKVTAKSKDCFNQTVRLYRFTTTAYVLAKACDLTRIEAIRVVFVR